MLDIPVPVVLAAGDEQTLEEIHAQLARDGSHGAAPLAIARAPRALTGAHRRLLVVRKGEELEALRTDRDPQRVCSLPPVSAPPEVAFLLPGGGSQYPLMGAGLLETEPVYAEAFARGCAFLEAHAGLDLRALVQPPPDGVKAAQGRLEAPSAQLPAIFVVGHALAAMWAARGIQPAALLGHSVGENLAAALAGVMRYEDALGLVALRGRLLERAAGAMLSVPLPAGEVVSLIALRELDLAATNAPTVSVVSGRVDAIEALDRELAARGIEAARLHINIAAHSRLLDGGLSEMAAYLRSIPLSPPRIPIVSNVSGELLAAADATDPDYWVTQFRSAVRFTEGVRTLASVRGRVCLEVGPGRVLGSLVGEHGLPGLRAVVASTRHPRERLADSHQLAIATGRLWAAGVRVPVDALWKDYPR